MKRTAKILSAMLALLLLISVVAVMTSCGGDTPEAPEGSSQGDAGSSDVAPGGPSESGEAPIPELEVVDLGGREILILWPELHVDGHYVHNEIAVTETSGDVIDMAVATRNAIVERMYNVKIVSETRFVSQIPKDVRNSSLNGEAGCDAMASTIKFMTTIAQEGLLADFNDVSHYDESQPWWNHRLMQDFAIADARYFATGDIIYSDDFYPYCTYVNMTVATDNRVEEDFYKLVTDREWTLEKFHVLAANVHSVSDSTANPNTWGVNDVAGAVMNENFARASYYAAGKGMISFNEQGHPQWEMTVAHTAPILELMIDIVYDGQACFNAGQFKNHAEVEIKSFNANQTLFLTEELIIAERITKSSDAADFQILPFPLYEEGGEFISVLNDAVVISIPVMADDQDDIALVLSSMGRESIGTLTPAFFETVLAERYMQDAQSVEMLQIVLNSTVAPDVATIQDWGGFMAEYKKLAFSGSTDFASYFESNIGEAEGAIREYIEMLNDYHHG